MRGIFITGTDTGAGKTVLAAAVAATLRARGERVVARKPVVTGLDEHDRSIAVAQRGESFERGDAASGRASAPRAPAPGGPWPPDHALLAAVTGQAPEDVAPVRFGPPVSPHLAAELAGTRLELPTLARAARACGAGADALVVEGVGGLLVPLAPDATVRDLAVALGLGVVVAARPGLGTINHTLLTVEAARAVGLDVRGVVLTPWPAHPGAMERSNRATIAAATGVPVATLPHVAAPTVTALSAAGAQLPVDAWLAPSLVAPGPCAVAPRP